MAERLAVDSNELDRFFRTLTAAVRSLERMHRALRNATVRGLGTDDLDLACDDFQAEWHYGTGRIGEQTDELAGIVRKSRASYAEVDKALEANLARGRGGRG